MKLQFSGHESFICKHLWLKKGFDFQGNFADESAVVELGVGKNMVTSIAYWLKAFGIKENDNVNSEISEYLFNAKNGRDPYIENIASLWLLHYYLIKTNKASLYSLFFNHFRRGRTEFTREHLHNFLKRILEDEKLKSFNENTLKSDVSVFLRSYLRPSSKETKIDIEEDFSALLIDLGIMTNYETVNDEKKIVEWYVVPNKDQIDLPLEVVLFSILDNYGNINSISFSELLIGFNSPGQIFCLHEDGLYLKIEAITKKYRQITYSESAGIRQIQFKGNLNKWEVLNGCY
jgi:hypothetical protein